LILIAALVWSVSTAGVFFATDLATFLIARAFTGVGKKN